MIPAWQSRTGLLIGDGALERLRNARVLLFGLGGVGGMTAEMLCRAGVGTLILIDGDTVEETNRNRQIAALCSTVGRLKTEIFRERLTDIDPAVHLEIRSTFVTAEEMPSLLEELRPDCIADAIDSVSPKVHLIAEALKKQIPIVSSMGSGARLDPEKIRCTDLRKTFNCTLARAVRQGLKKLGSDGRGCRVIFSEEPVVRSAVLDTGIQLRNKRSTTGTVSYLPALFGCHQAAEVIRLLI